MERLVYVGHVVIQERGMENDVLPEGMSGKRRLGRQRTRCLDTLKTQTYIICRRRCDLLRGTSTMEKSLMLPRKSPVF